MGIPDVENISKTISFDAFWSWLAMHNNCILRAGTPDVLMFDHDDFHWHFFVEGHASGNSAHIVQLVRGKVLITEMVVIQNDIAYVQVADNEHEETIFECVLEMPEGREVAYHFVLAHGYDGEESSSDGGGSPRRWTH